jgi:type VI secretion system protein VasG
VQEAHRVSLVCDDTVIDAVAARCTEVESGARNVDNILTNTLLPDISRILLESLASGSKPAAIRVALSEDGNFAYHPQTHAAGSLSFDARPPAAVTSA